MITEHVDHCRSVTFFEGQVQDAMCYCPWILREPAWQDFVSALDRMPRHLREEVIKHINHMDR